MNPDLWLAQFVNPPLSYVVFGALGGLLYVLRQHLRSNRVRRVEYIARPVFGAVAAFVITVSLQLPNHFTSLFVGYFGVDAWDALASRFDGKLPFASKHEPKEFEDEADDSQLL